PSSAEAVYIVIFAGPTGVGIVLVCVIGLPGSKMRKPPVAGENFSQLVVSSARTPACTTKPRTIAARILVFIAVSLKAPCGCQRPAGAPGSGAAGDCLPSSEARPGQLSRPTPTPTSLCKRRDRALGELGEGVGPGPV